MPVRVYEISRKWGIRSADLVERLSELGVGVTSHVSAIGEEDVAILAKDIVRRPIKPSKKKQRKPAVGKFKPISIFREEPVIVEEPAAPAVEAPLEPVAAQAAEGALETAPGPQEVERDGLTVRAAAPEAELAAPVTAEKAAEEAMAAEAAGQPEGEAGKEPQRRMIVLPPQKGAKEKEQRPPVVDETLLREQIEQAAQVAQRESEEESRILRKIVLPPHKRTKKKRKVPTSLDRARSPRIIAPSRPEKVELHGAVTIRDFSQASGIKSGDIVKKLMGLGVMASVNQPLSQEVVELLGAEFGVQLAIRKSWSAETELERIEQEAQTGGDVRPRSPVVTLLGHVDHGKTSLLDAIRHSDVTSGEFGGITQHTGAYRVKTDNGHTITFLDTPGHEAFTEMRARGANVTDIAILVVAADDGVMPQTVEAVNHAKAANVPIVVAVNKIDKPEAQVERVKRQLTNYGLVPEEWGGDTLYAPVSATTGKGIEELLETLALQAEVLELKADVARPARGVVIEARRSEGRGPVSTVLVQEGTLRVGDVMVAGAAYGRIRSMSDERGIPVIDALPSMPVEVCGLGDMPSAGDKFIVLADLASAREIAESKLSQKRADARAERRHVSLENLMESFQAGQAKELRIVIKADVQGTLEVLNRTLSDLSVPEVVVRVIHSGVGGINESDVLLADASDAVVVGFNVVAESAARAEADSKSVEIRLYNVIYHLIEEMRAALENRLEPEIREVVRGRAEVRNTFKISRIGTIAGCMVTSGIIPRRATMRVARQGIVVFEGGIGSLKHFKDDVREVREGFECGIKLEGFDDIKVGDVFEAFETEKIPRKLS